MKVKVFQSNHNGKIEFTRAELEKLLNEVYTDGYNEGKSSHWTWTSPYLNGTVCSNSSTILDGTNTEINKDLLTQISNATESKVEAPKITTTNNSTKPNTYTVTMKCSEADINKAAETLREMLNAPNALSTAKIDDAFTKLAKELSF